MYIRLKLKIFTIARFTHYQFNTIKSQILGTIRSVPLISNIGIIYIIILNLLIKFAWNH